MQRVLQQAIFARGLKRRHSAQKNIGRSGINRFQWEGKFPEAHGNCGGGSREMFCNSLEAFALLVSRVDARSKP